MEEILDVDLIVTQVGDIIRKYNNFWEVVEDEGMLKGKPIDGSGRIIYLPNHKEDFTIIGKTIVASFEQDFLNDKFLHHLVDTVHGIIFEDNSVPSTKWAKEMIAKARETFKPE